MKDYTKGKTAHQLEPFFPNELFRHTIVACFLIIVELVAVIFLPIPVAAVNTPDHVPWFLLPVYYVKMLIRNEVAFFSFLIVCSLVFILWPFIATVFFKESRKKDI